MDEKLNLCAAMLGLTEVDEDICKRTKISLLGKIHELAADSDSDSIFENEVKQLLIENYPGLKEFLLSVKDSRDKDGIKKAQIIFGADNILKIRHFLNFAYHVQRYHCKHSDEETCRYCDCHKAPSLDDYEGRGLQDRLDDIEDGVFDEEQFAHLSIKTLRTIKTLRKRALSDLEV